jgi:hypothetical protein
MRAKVTCRWFLLPVLVCVVLSSAVMVRVEGGKPTPPPPPPVYYNVTWLDSIDWFDNLDRKYTQACAINKSGDVVGFGYNVIDSAEGSYNADFAAFVYDASNQLSLDLNALELMPGWSFIRANGINESRQIVGGVVNKTTGEYRGFMFNLSDRMCVLLPDPVQAGQAAQKINNDLHSGVGDVLATEGSWITQYTWDGDKYVMKTGCSWLTDSFPTGFNDSGQILLRDGARYTPGGVPEWEDFGATYGIRFAQAMNNDGTFVGNRVLPNGGKLYSFRFTNPDQMVNIATGRAAAGVNSDGDVCVNPSTRAYVYTDMNHWGLLALDNMVTGDVSDWMDATLTYVTGITDRYTGLGVPTNFGSICGYAVFTTSSKGTTTTTGYRAFMLTPSP